jgi:hypothetical protein
MATPKPDASSSIYRLKITLGGVDPPVWRRIEVEDCPLEILHGVIQDAMGWSNFHLYEFRIDGVAYTNPVAVDEDNRSAAEMTLAQLAKKQCLQLDYLYDFSDQWRHRVEIEAVVAPEPGVHYPRCVEGQRACPPEDCGGASRYATLLEVLKDPDHEEYDDFADFIRDDFDLEAFDPQRVNRIWAHWDFSDPNSGPVYDDQAPREDVETLRPKSKAKAEAKAEPKAEPKPAGPSRVGRNDPCPCGSGKKYKKCCMKKGKGGEYEE